MSYLHTVSVSLPEPVYQRLIEEAHADGDDLSDWIGRAVARCINDRAPNKARRKSRRPQLCKGCPNYRRIKARGYCGSCYRREVSFPNRPMRVCVVCSQYRPHYARGKCDTCYRRPYAERARRRAAAAAATAAA